MRALQDVAKYVPFREALDTLAAQPASAGAGKGTLLDQLLATPTNRRYLQWRLTPTMEERTLFVMDKVGRR